MPKQTFFNLPLEKQTRILDAALIEFARHPFKKVTIDHIVEGASIPKGSFYQYFKDKKDIYKYLFNHLSLEKKETLEGFYDQMNHLSFSEFIRKWYLLGIEFTLDNQATEDLRYQFMNNCRHELREEILDIMIPKSNELFEHVLEFYVKKGELSEEISIRHAAEILTTLTLFLSKNYKNTPSKKIIVQEIDKMLTIIELGIQRRHS